MIREVEIIDSANLLTTFVVILYINCYLLLSVTDFSVGVVITYCYILCFLVDCLPWHDTVIQHIHKCKK